MKINLGTLTIASPAFDHGGLIPTRYTGSGDGVSPPLVWSNPPAGTKSFALVSDDPDAPLITGFPHWVAYGIPAEATELAENAQTGFVSGLNGIGTEGWVPPGPPPGHGDHFYYFHIYALNADLGLAPGLTKDQLLATIDEHVIEQARVVGRYGNSA